MAYTHGGFRGSQGNTNCSKILVATAMIGQVQIFRCWVVFLLASRLLKGTKSTSLRRVTPFFFSSQLVSIAYIKRVAARFAEILYIEIIGSTRKPSMISARKLQIG